MAPINPTLSARGREAANKVIGQRLARALEFRNITADDAAALIGISPAKMARVLKGSSELSAAEFVWMGASLRVTLDSLGGR